MDKLRKLNLLIHCIDMKMKWNHRKVLEAKAKNMFSLYENENDELQEIRIEIHKEFCEEYDKKYEYPD